MSLLNLNRLMKYIFWVIPLSWAFLIGSTLWTAFTDPRIGYLLFLLIVDTFCIGMGGWLMRSIYKEGIVKIGVVERVLERRRIAAAAATAEKYRGINLMDTPEAKSLPTPRYRCSNEGCSVGYARYGSDDIYWVEGQPLLPAGWYCVDCVGKMPDKAKDDRLNMEVFLILMDSDVAEKIE